MFAEVNEKMHEFNFDELRLCVCSLIKADVDLFLSFNITASELLKRLKESRAYMSSLDKRQYRVKKSREKGDIYYE